MYCRPEDTNPRVDDMAAWPTLEASQSSASHGSDFTAPMSFADMVRHRHHLPDIPLPSPGPPMRKGWVAVAKTK